MKRDEEGDIVAFERGDVIWDVDPFKQEPVSDTNQTEGETDGVAPRPWLVISTDSVPFHPDQYLCLTLTSRTWHDDSIPISTTDWETGGAPEDTSIMPRSISAIQHKFLDTTGDLVARLDDVHDVDDSPDNGFQGHLKPGIVDQATRRLTDYLDESLSV